MTMFSKKGWKLEVGGQKILPYLASNFQLLTSGLLCIFVGTNAAGIGAIAFCAAKAKAESPVQPP